MKAITLSQPWASLVAISAKKIETRGWRTSYRGPLAIHAAKGFPAKARVFCESPTVWRALGWSESSAMPSLRFGVVVATCNLVDILPMRASLCLSGVFDDYPDLDTPQERAFGDYSAGRWAWILKDIVQLPEPIPAKGALSLWEWDQPAYAPGTAVRS